MLDLDESTAARIFSKILLPQCVHADCWLWTDAPDSYGYGRIKIGGKVFKAHRLVYFLCRGAIPNDCTLDHTCLRRCCVNPYHLEPVSLAENTRRMQERRKQIKQQIKHNHIVGRAR